MSGDICPNCGSDDFGTFADTDGRAVEVCGVCAYDGDHGVTTKRCPGGCGAWIDKGVLCCDPCWARIPTRVPGFDRPWRTARNRARHRRGGWADFERATDAVLAWLIDHPTATPVDLPQWPNNDRWRLRERRCRESERRA